MYFRLKSKFLPLIGIALILELLLWISSAASASTNAVRVELMRRIGHQDAVVLAQPDGRVMFEKNAARQLVPASILKVFTALFVLDALGADHHYATEFYLDDQRNLTIKGSGDPLLISEVIADICKRLAQAQTDAPVLNHLQLDESHFAKPLTIPGVSASSQPYDAPNGALCVNFNTVNFKRIKGRLMSAEPQTPLIPFALDRIIERQATEGRIVFSSLESENTLYAGELFRYFLEKEGY